MITLEPKEDYTDVGQAYILAREYSKILRYSKSTGFIVTMVISGKTQTVKHRT